MNRADQHRGGRGRGAELRGEGRDSGAGPHQHKLGGAKNGDGTNGGSNIHGHDIHDNTQHGQLTRDGQLDRDDAHRGLLAHDGAHHRHHWRNTHDDACYRWRARDGGCHGIHGHSSAHHGRDTHDDAYHGQHARDDAHYGLLARDLTKEGAKKETKGLERAARQGQRPSRAPLERHPR